MGEREGRGQSDLTAALKISLDISFFRQDLFLPLLFSWKQTVKKRTKRDKRKTCSIQKPKRDIRQEEEITNRGGEEDSKTEKKKKVFSRSRPSFSCHRSPALSYLHSLNLHAFFPLFDSRIRIGFYLYS